MHGTIRRHQSWGLLTPTSYIHRVNNSEFVFDTQEIKEILGDVPLDSTEVLSWIMDYITEGLGKIREDKQISK